MSIELHEHAGRPGRNVRLDTLVRLRWVAVIGQTTAVLVVYYGLDFELPIWACLAVIVLAAWLNVALRVRCRVTQRIEPDRAAWLLAFDIAEIAILLFLTGGLQNPFSFLLLGPVLLSATALPPRMIGMLGGLLTTIWFQGQASSVYIASAKEAISYDEILGGLIKPTVFGFIIAIIGCYRGLSTTGGTVGVGRSTTQSVVDASILIIAVDFLLSKLIISMLLAP